MAKRVPSDDKPFRPVDEALIRSVMAGPPPATDDGGGRGVVVAMAAPAPFRAEPAMQTAKQPTPFLRPAQPESDRLSAPRRLEAAPISIPSDASLERRDREKRVLLTLNEERDVERLVGRLAGELRTPVKLSHVLRACITIVLHAEEELIERARKTTLIRPGNGNAPELAEFEFGVAQVVATALREARPLR